MLKDITIGPFFPGETFIHKLDPRVKIILSFVYIVALFLAVPTLRDRSQHSFRKRKKEAAGNA